MTSAIFFLTCAYYVYQISTISPDNDMNSNATIKADFSSDYVQSLLSTQTFEYIHASPVCRTYSRLAGGKHRTKSNYNKSLDSHEADAMLTSLYLFLAKVLQENEGTTVTIENPRGWMQYGNIAKELLERELGFKRYQIYCTFLPENIHSFLLSFQSSFV